MRRIGSGKSFRRKHNLHAAGSGDPVGLKHYLDNVHMDALRWVRSYNNNDKTPIFAFDDAHKSVGAVIRHELRHQHLIVQINEEVVLTAKAHVLLKHVKS